jgi:hypothetical protein
MTRLLLCTATILALTASANAQRETSWFGPNSSAGGYAQPYPPNCTWGGAYCPKIEQPKTRRTTGKKGR